MNPVLRTLDDWATHQDYFWFLALLAWCGVIGAEIRRRPANAAGEADSQSRWLVALALSMAAGVVLEITLLAQTIMIPYTRLDAAMGAAQAAGTAALVWGATLGLARRTAVALRIVAALALAALTAWRMSRPVEAGWLLARAQAVALLGLLRGRTTQVLPPSAALLLLAVPLVATHGPWAYAIRHGRKTTDWSHFSLVAATVCALAGVILATAAWRRRLRQTVPELVPDSMLRRDLRRAVVVLVLWLAGGVLLAVWYGRVARRAFEENLLRRVEMAVLAFDAGMLADAFGPELRISSIARRRYSDGRPVDVATVPRTREPVFIALRAQLGRIHRANPDFSYFHFLTPRRGQMLLLNSGPRPAEDVRHVVHHRMTADDLLRLAERRSYLEGPVHTTWSAQFSAKAPFFDPKTGQVLGWVTADVDATRWTATFVQARLQTMALVAAGVGLWTMAVAYRLRREARDAAERKASAAAAADRMKSAFLAKVSHELRTPIQSVLGYSEMLGATTLPEPQRTWLAALRAHGDVMLRLVNDLIDLGALQSGAFRLEPGAVELPALVADCSAALRPAAEEKRLQFRTEIAGNVPEWIEADGVRLRQILLNLLTNAVKYTPAGSVTLRVQCPGHDRIELVVTDTGPGIPPVLRSRLFQPFARLDPAASGGSGLGLALVKGLCAVMGGDVRLEAMVKEGATFVASLPLRACARPATPAAEAGPARDFAGLRVLVAEDNTLVRELLTAFLREHDADVTLAVDGPSALARARELKPDVLLLDIALPELDGIQVATALREHGPADLRIIGLSAHASREDERRARAAGMDEFLAKPVSLARLAEAIGGAGEPIPTPRTQILDLPEALRVRLAGQFAQETPRLLAEMRGALAAADWAELRTAAHYLKNSADIVGFADLQDACRRLSLLTPPVDPVMAARLLEEVEASIPEESLAPARPAIQG